jgi:predicted nucleic acid-binding protein
LHLLNSGEFSVDSNVVADFFLVGQLDLFCELLQGRLLASDFVINELEKANIRLPRADVVTLVAEGELAVFDSIRKNNLPLGTGEIGSLTVANLRGCGILTNDSRARQAAKELGIPVSGTLGVLEYAVEADRISAEAAVEILEQMLQAGAWFSDELVRMFRTRILEIE